MCSRFDIETVIGQFKPAWLPEGNELPGVVVAIDPAGGGSAGSQKRIDEDAALMIGGYLFHLVQAGGGVPVMTRADDRAIPGDRDAYIAALCKAKSVDVAIAIDCSRESGAAAKIGFVLGSFGSTESGDSSNADGSGESASVGGETNQPGVTCDLEIGPKDGTEFEYRRSLYGQAVSVFKALVEFCSNQEDELKGLRAECPASGPVGSVPLFPNRTSEEALALAARKVWPDGDLPLEKAGWFCNMFVQTFHDHTFVYHEPVVSVEDDTVIISGATNTAILRHSLADALKVIGIPKVRNEMRLLPEQGRTGEDRFGLCVSSMALTYAGPAETEPLCTQLLYGEPVMLLDAEEDYYLVCGRDGYCGWVRRACIGVVDRETYSRFANAGSAVFVEDTILADRRIVRGSILPVVSVGEAEVILLGCDMEEFAVPACNVNLTEETHGAEEKLQKALSFLHLPYVFGAVSSVGLDCSGLVRNVHAQMGKTVSRDAFQQFLPGKLVATRWYRDDIKPGDLLYFINGTGKIFHVAFALTNKHFIHSAPPEVKINSLDKDDPLYSEYRDSTFLAARRLS